MLSILHKIHIISCVSLKNFSSIFFSFFYPYFSFKIQKGMFLVVMFCFVFKTLKHRSNVFLISMLLFCQPFHNFFWSDWHYYHVLLFVQTTCKYTWVCLIAFFPVKSLIFSQAISGDRFREIQNLNLLPSMRIYCCLLLDGIHAVYQCFARKCYLKLCWHEF